LYFIARLKPTTSEIKIDPLEIADARWLPVSKIYTWFIFLTHCQIDEYINDPAVNDTNKEIAKLAMSHCTDAEPLLYQEREYSVISVPNWNKTANHLLYRSGK